MLQLVLDAGPDGVAGLLGEVEEAAGLVGDGFEVADEGCAVGVVVEEGLEARVGADAASVGEDLGEVLFEVRRGHGVEVREPGVGHTATSSMPVGSTDSGWRRSSRSLRRAL